jgi:hypothetical protein
VSRFEFIRLRGTIIAISTFFTIVSLYVIIDQRPAGPASDTDRTPTTTVRQSTATTIPIDNRLCGAAQRVRDSAPRDQPGLARVMQDFYTEASTFTEGDLRGDLLAAARFYKEVNDIAVKANWDVDRIVRNNEGARWKALLTGTPTGVDEARAAIAARCRITLPDPPVIELDSTGQIRDQRLAKLLEQPDKELPESVIATTTTRPA